MPTADKFAGSLIGLCLGDALGAALEGHRPDETRRYVESELRPRKGVRWKRGPAPVGQYTDDSQLARELLLSLVEQGRFLPEDYARRIATLVKTQRLVGGGRGTKLAAKKLIDGVPWEEAATPPPYAGNGCAMRVGPLGVLYSGDPNQLIEIAVRQSRVTHQEPRCAAGAVAIADAVALAAKRGRIDSGEFLEHLAERADPLAPGFGAALRQVQGWLELPPGKISAAAVRGGIESPTAPPKWQGGVSPFVVPSVCAALYAFLRSPDDYWETVCTAIAVGGDTDTVAAMAGAISGARMGLVGLPDALARQVSDDGTWGYEELVHLSSACWAVSHS